MLIPNTVTEIDPRCMNRGEKGWIRSCFFKDDNAYFLKKDGFVFSKDEKTLCFAAKRTEVKKLVIPDGVEKIGKYAFCNLEFESVSIPASVKCIGSFAFYYTRYKTVEIPETVEEIGEYIAHDYSLEGNNKFYKIVDDCVYTADGKKLVQCVRGYEIPQLATIRIPDQLVSLEDNTFGYQKCNSVRVGKGNPHFYSDGKCFFSVNEKGEKRLLKCFKKKEEEYVVPEGVTDIAPRAFGECVLMKKLSLPKSLLRFDSSCLVIPGYDGSKCGVKKITIPENVSDLKVLFQEFSYAIEEENSAYFIENNILYHREENALEIVAAKNIRGELTIKEGVTVIKAKAFSSCKNLTKVICNPELRVIEHHAFSDGWNPTSIKEVVLNEGLERIDYMAFLGSKIETVRVPASVKYICISAFHACANGKFEVEEGNSQYKSVDGVLYNKSMTELRFVPKEENFEKFQIPFGVTEIGVAFRGCKTLYRAFG